MKRSIINICIILLILAIPLINLAVAQIQDNLSPKDKIEENYKKLNSKDFTERREGAYFFSKLKKGEIPEMVFKSTVQLFKEELGREKIKEDFFKRGGIADKLPTDIAYLNSEAYIMYQGYLCNIMGKSGDKTLLPLLVQHCLEARVLNNFGEAAVEPVLNVLETVNNPGQKMSAIFVLTEMLKMKDEGYTPRGKTRRNIIDALVKALKDSNRYVRLVSVKALGESQDKDVIPIVDDVAKNDAYFYEKKDENTGNIEKIYPVRMKAKEVLENLKKTNK
jgi:hypothetical protein